MQTLKEEACFSAWLPNYIFVLAPIQRVYLWRMRVNSCTPPAAVLCQASACEEVALSLGWICNNPPPPLWHHTISWKEGSRWGGGGGWRKHLADILQTRVKTVPIYKTKITVWLIFSGIRLTCLCAGAIFVGSPRCKEKEGERSDRWRRWGESKSDRWVVYLWHALSSYM